MVPAPMSATATPSSRSVSVSTASPEANEATTSSSGRTPAWRTHLVRFWSAVALPCTMWVATSRRMALMPSGSLTPSWPSTVKSRGRTCRTSRLEGIVTARATSVARSMSSRVISRWAPLTATVPREFRDSRWSPPTPTKAASRRRPERRSACTMAWWIEVTVCSMLLTRPLRTPADGKVPLPMMSTDPSLATSPTSTTTLLVPTSSATRTASISKRFPSSDHGWLPASPRCADAPSLWAMPR